MQGELETFSYLAVPEPDHILGAPGPGGQGVEMWVFAGKSEGRRLSFNSSWSLFSEIFLP